MALDPSVDLDAEAGANLSGWPNVLQSLEQIFTTNFGERVMREWFGSAVPRFLGENLNTQTVVPFFAAISAAIEQWEPRFRVTQIVPESLGRDGHIQILIEGEYRPRALLGDQRPEGPRRVTVSGNSNNWVVANVAS
jgi:hypothetical protein